MKKWFVILLCAMLLMTSGCRQSPEPVEATTAPTQTTAPTTAPTTVPPETEPTTEPPETEPPVTEPPEPETVEVSARGIRTDVILTTLPRGSTVSLAGEFDEDYYVVKTEAGYGLLEKRLVRPENENPFEAWNGYAKSGAKLFDNYHLLNTEGTRSLSTNSKLLVLEKLGDVYLVQHGEAFGYMHGNRISTYYIESKPDSGSADGGDISLGMGGSVSFLAAMAPKEAEVSGSALVLADEAEVLLGWYDRGDTVRMITEAGFGAEKEGFCLVYQDGFTGYVRKELLAMKDSEAYQPWDGYAHASAGVYDSLFLDTEPVTKLSGNTAVHVLEDLGYAYLVTVGDITGYMDKEDVSQTKISYGGGSGGGEWSDPVM